jgi:hypothetical protein
MILCKLHPLTLNLWRNWRFSLMCTPDQVWIAIGILDGLTLISTSVLIQHELLCLFFQLLHGLLLCMWVIDILLLR